MENTMQELSDRRSQVPTREGTRSSDPVACDISALIERVRASIGLVEAAMRRADTEDLDTDGNEEFFILDDVSPRYSKLRTVLNAVEASLSATLHDA
jgi:hypothetical protein